MLYHHLLSPWGYCEACRGIKYDLGNDDGIKDRGRKKRAMESGGGWLMY